MAGPPREPGSSRPGIIIGAASYGAYYGLIRGKGHSVSPCEALTAEGDKVMTAPQYIDIALAAGWATIGLITAKSLWKTKLRTPREHVIHGIGVKQTGIGCLLVFAVATRLFRSGSFPIRTTSSEH